MALPLTLDQIADLIGNKRISGGLIDKASIANQTAAGWTSLWRATGTPAQAAIPATAAVCDDTFTGSLLTFTNPTSPIFTYIPQIYMQTGNSLMLVEFHDRLMACGGLSLNVTTSQTVGVDASNVALANRIGASNYSDLQWWLECYSDGGATASNATLNATYGDNSTGALALVSVGGTLRAGRMIPLPSNSNGKFIKSIDTAALSAATGTAGSWGVTVTRRLTGVFCGNANQQLTYPWDVIGIPRVPDDACVMMLTQNSTTSSGTVKGGAPVGQV